MSSGWVGGADLVQRYHAPRVVFLGSGRFIRTFYIYFHITRQSSWGHSQVEQAPFSFLISRLNLGTLGVPPWERADIACSEHHGGTVETRVDASG
jgi:hypothetical protein